MQRNLLILQNHASEWFDFVDNLYFDKAQSVWDGAHDYGRCTNANSAPALWLRMPCVLMGVNRDRMGRMREDCPAGHDFLMIDGHLVYDIWVHKYIRSGPFEKRWMFDIRSHSDHPSLVHMYGSEHHWESLGQLGQPQTGLADWNSFVNLRRLNAKYPPTH